MRFIQSTLLFAAAAAVADAAKEFVDISELDQVTIWNKFQSAFGASRVQSSFSSPGSLVSAIAAEDESATQVGCSVSYAYGADLADELREQEHYSGILPFFVSPEDDTICFMLPADAPKIPALEFQVAYPSSLKVHDSITASVSSLSAIAAGSDTPVSPLDTLIRKLRNGTANEQRLQLSVSLANVTTKLRGAVRGALDGPSPLMTLIQTLREYKTALLEKFYFVTPNDFSTLSEPEKARVVDWRHARDALLAHLNARNAAGAALSPDPCGFRQAVTRFVQDIRAGNDPAGSFDLSGMTAVGNASLASGCLAFVAAAVAQNAGTMQVALSTSLVPFNYRARSILQASSPGTSSSVSPYSASGILGSGQVVSVADTGLDMQSCFFKDSNGNVQTSLHSSPVTQSGKRKVVQYCHTDQSDTSDVAVGHGTHVAGTIAGKIENANLYTDGQFNGVAPNAKIAFMDLGNANGRLTSLAAENLYLPGRSAGARIHTNSWGGYYSGSPFYAGASVDSFLYENPDQLIFFAAGNGGDFMPDPSLSQQSSAKNIIVVGSGETTLHSKDVGNVAYYSSKGPAHDGRFKPDIVAPGDALLSASASGSSQSTCSTAEKSGTSMASPAAAGAAALIRQYLMDSKYWAKVCNPTYASCGAFTPSGVMLKALILHSGEKMDMWNGDREKRELGNPPDSVQGYGRLTMTNVLPFPNSPFDLYVRDIDSLSLDQNSVKNHYFWLADSGEPLKVTLVWFDPPNVDGITSKALLHDLDLKVLSPLKEVFLGNRMADTRNSNEQVHVRSPETGVWQITVKSKALPVTGSQKYALVITGGGYVGPAPTTFDVNSIESGW